MLPSSHRDHHLRSSCGAYDQMFGKKLYHFYWDCELMERLDLDVLGLRAGGP